MDIEQKSELEASIVAILGDDAPIDQIMAAIEKNSHYSVQAVSEYNYYDIDNRPRSRIEDDSIVLRAPTIAELYESMARFRIKYETSKKRPYDDYTLIYFRNLTQVLGSYDLQDETSVDEDCIKQTVVWKKHQEELDQKQIEEEKEIEREKLREEQKIKEQELALLASLQEKYKDA